MGLTPVTCLGDIKGHIKRRNQEKTRRSVLEWKSKGKRPHGRPRMLKDVNKYDERIF